MEFEPANLRSSVKKFIVSKPNWNLTELNPSH